MVPSDGQDVEKAERPCFASGSANRYNTSESDPDGTCPSRLRPCPLQPRLSAARRAQQECVHLAPCPKIHSSTPQVPAGSNMHK